MITEEERKLIKIVRLSCDVRRLEHEMYVNQFLLDDDKDKHIDHIRITASKDGTEEHCLDSIEIMELLRPAILEVVAKRNKDITKELSEISKIIK